MTAKNEATCWPEQEAVQAWLKDMGLEVDRVHERKLIAAVTKPRREAQQMAERLGLLFITDTTADVLAKVLPGLILAIEELGKPPEEQNLALLPVDTEAAARLLTARMRSEKQLS